MLTLSLVVLYAIMPVAIMTTDIVPSPAFYMAVLLSLALAYRRKASVRDMFSDYKVVLLCYGMPAAAVLISCAVHGHWAGSGAEAALRVSLGLPILLLALQAVPAQTLRQSMWGVYAAAVAATAYVVGLAFPTFSRRPVTTIYNAVSYGNLMLLLAVLTLFSLRWRLTRRSGPERAVKLCVAVLALAGFVVTQTRSGWVAVPLFALIGVALATGFRRPWRAVGLFLAVVSLAVALGASSASLRDRVETGFAQMQACQGSASTSNTSVCIRFQLWRSAWHAFTHNPVLGLGDHSLFRDWMQTRALPDGVVSSYVAHNFGEPHNDMMQALASFGVLGALGLLMMYFAPAWLFIRRMGAHNPPAVRAAAAMGAAFCLGFALFGLTELMFRGMRTVSFYTMFVALFLALSDPRPKLNGGL